MLLAVSTLIALGAEIVADEAGEQSSLFDRFLFSFLMAIAVDHFVI